MARKSREIRIFNLSFLDVLSCGLGAVVTLLLVAFKDTSAYEAAKAENVRVQEALKEVQSEHEERQRVVEEVKKAIEELKKQGEKSKEKVAGLLKDLDELRVINFVGIRTKKKNIVILIDLSGSMYWPSAHYGNASEKVVMIAETLVGMLPDDCRFNVVGFGDKGGIYPAWRPGLELHLATRANKEEATQRMKSMVETEGGGGTPTGTALQRAFAHAGVEAVFLLTDGAPDGCYTQVKHQHLAADAGKLEEFLKGVTQRNTNGVEIHCVGLGKSLFEDDHFRDFLRMLADQNGKGGFASF